MSFATRLQRHARLTLRARRHDRGETPPFLIVFINSICNLTCEHCFYWRNLNQRNDLSYEEFVRLSEELGSIETLNLSGGFSGAQALTFRIDQNHLALAALRGNQRQSAQQHALPRTGG